VVSFAHRAGEISVRYRALRDGRFRFADGAHARIHAWSAEAIDVEIDGRRIRARITRAADRVIVHGPRGNLELAVLPRFELPGAEQRSGGFVARMPGKVIELRVQVGDAVTAGQALLVLEAMKMEHSITAPADGRVERVNYAASDLVEEGAELVVFAVEDED